MSKPLGTSSATSTTPGRTTTIRRSAQRLPRYQLCLVDADTGYPVAVANSVPFACSGPDDLPAEGWDWVVETAARTKNTRLDMLGALAISVPAVHRSKGYARL